MEGIGIVFDIDDLDGGAYGSAAWRIFMRNLPGPEVAGCTLLQGDTQATLMGSRRDFCIAVRGPGLDVSSVRRVFERCGARGLAPPERRFIVGSALDAEPLAVAGEVDSQGRFVEEEWCRIFHDRCKDSGWGYAPTSVPGSLSSELTAELRKLSGQTSPARESVPRPAKTDAKHSGGWKIVRGEEARRRAAEAGWGRDMPADAVVLRPGAPCESDAILVAQGVVKCHSCGADVPFSAEMLGGMGGRTLECRNCRCEISLTDLTCEEGSILLIATPLTSDSNRLGAGPPRIAVSRILR